MCFRHTSLLLQKARIKQCRCDFDPKTVLTVVTWRVRSGRVLIVTVQGEQAHGHIPNEDFEETERTKLL